jgi:type II secretory ATPase GspE/PulE/Tfp pilus assembly ATPase PilB-like protein
LIISTLHTSDALGAVTRLQDIGIDPYLVAHTLSCVRRSAQIVRCYWHS